jgi:hypothetical protein
MAAARAEQEPPLELPMIEELKQAESKRRDEQTAELEVARAWKRS